MSLPLDTTSYLISVLSSSKVIQLPAASTITVGKLFFIKDLSGNASRSTIFVSTTGLDTIEYRNRPSTLGILMSTNYQTLLLAPDGVTNWMILQNYTANVIFKVIPRNMPGVVLWLDGTDPAGTGVAPANGSSITTWVDKSGAGNNATAGTAPTFNSTGINGKGTVSFNGTNTFLSSQDLYSARAFTIFAIARRQAAIATVVGLIGGTDFNTNRVLTFGYRSNTSITCGFYNNDLNGTIPAYTGNTATEPAYLFGCSYISGSRLLFSNGTQIASDTNATNLISQVGARIGNYSSGWFNGFIGEIVVLNGTPNTTTRQQMEGYLSWKWGLQTSLPTTHPFRNFPP